MPLVGSVDGDSGAEEEPRGLTQNNIPNENSSHPEHTKKNPDTHIRFRFTKYRTGFHLPLWNFNSVIILDFFATKRTQSFSQRAFWESWGFFFVQQQMKSGRTMGSISPSCAEINHPFVYHSVYLMNVKWHQVISIYNPFQTAMLNYPIFFTIAHISVQKSEFSM